MRRRSSLRRRRWFEVTPLPLAEQLRAGLLAHWTFDSPDGAHDASGHGHDLQVSADAVPACSP